MVVYFGGVNEKVKAHCSVRRIISLSFGKRSLDSEAMRDGDEEGVFEAVRGDGNECFEWRSE